MPHQDADDKRVDFLVGQFKARDLALPLCGMPFREVVHLRAKRRGQFAFTGVVEEPE